MPKTQTTPLKDTALSTVQSTSAPSSAKAAVAVAVSSASALPTTRARRAFRGPLPASVNTQQEENIMAAAKNKTPATTTTTAGTAVATSAHSTSASASAVGKSSSHHSKGYVPPEEVKEKEKQKTKPVDPSNPTPWRHPAELPYICREDWSQDLMIEYLCQKSFTVPAREPSSVQLLPIVSFHASPIGAYTSGMANETVYLPRAYRVPLMFLAKFQWESLRLVLTSSDPAEEWKEYKFDIMHISRLCQHLFEQARDAQKPMGSEGGSGAVTGKGLNKAKAKGFDKSWRSPMFDRVLTRFYHHWFVSREWSLKNFYEEFDEEEYEIDVLSYNWARWALKGHKGFTLTKDEVQSGITAEAYMRGLGRRADGVWVWDSGVGSGAAVPATSLTTNLTSSTAAATNTPANNTIQVKREQLENASVSGTIAVAAGSTTAGSASASNLTDKFAVITFPPDTPPEPASNAHTPADAAINRPSRSRSGTGAPAATGVSAPTAGATSKVTLKISPKMKGKEKTNGKEKEKEKAKETTNGKGKEKEKERAKEKEKEKAKEKAKEKHKTKVEPPPSPVVGSKRPREEDGVSETGESVSASPTSKRLKLTDPIRPVSKLIIGKSTKPAGTREAGVGEGLSALLNRPVAKQTARKSISYPLHTAKQRQAELKKKILHADSDSDDSTADLSEEGADLMRYFGMIPGESSFGTRMKVDPPSSPSVPTAAASTSAATATSTSQKRKVSINGANGTATESAKEPENKKAKTAAISAKSILEKAKHSGRSSNPFEAAASAQAAAAYLKPTPISAPASASKAPPSTVAGLASALTITSATTAGSGPWPAPRLLSRTKPYQYDFISSTKAPAQSQTRTTTQVEMPVVAKAAVPTVAAPEPTPPKNASSVGNASAPSPASAKTTPLNVTTNTTQEATSKKDIGLSTAAEKERKKEKVDEQNKGKDEATAPVTNMTVTLGEAAPTTSTRSTSGENASQPKAVAPATANGNIPAVPAVAAPTSSASPTSPTISATTSQSNTTTKPTTQAAIPPAPAPVPAPTPTRPVPKSPPAPVVSTPKPITTSKSPSNALPRISSPISPLLSLSPSPKGNGKAMSTILSVLPLISGPIKAPTVSPTKVAAPTLTQGVVGGTPASGTTGVEHGFAVNAVPASEPVTGVVNVEKPVADDEPAKLREETSRAEKNAKAVLPLVDALAAKVLNSGSLEAANVVNDSASPVNITVENPAVVVKHAEPAEVVQGGVVGLVSTLKDAGGNGEERTEDKMDVDEPTERPTLTTIGLVNPPTASSILQPADEHVSSEQSVGLLMTQGTRAKSLHTILLLRDLLQFLRIPDIAEAKGARHIIDTQAHYALLDDQEAMTMDQRLDILAHASVALAKVLFPFRGKELETRISSLDNRLQQQFELLWEPEERPMKDIQPLAKISEEKEVQTRDMVSASLGVQTDEVKVIKPTPVEPKSVTSQETQTVEQERCLGSAGVQTEKNQASQETQTVEQARFLGTAGVQTEKNQASQETQTNREERQLGSAGVQTEEGRTLDIPPPSPGPQAGWAHQLSPEATMVDILAPPPPSASAAILDFSKIIPPNADRNNPAAKAMTSIMRNIADLLEYATLNSASSVSAKGKEREISVGDGDMPPVDTYAGSPVVDAIVTEFRAMKDELRLSQQKDQEESEPMSALHHSEVESLKEELRSMQDRKADEIEEMKRRHREEVQELRNSIRMMEKDKEKKQEPEETRIPALELLELRRRISSLEARTRTDSDNPVPTSQHSPAPTHYPEPSIQRQTSLHPLGHLLTHDFDDTLPLSSPVAGRAFVRETSTPNPGTPVSTGHSLSSRHPDGMEVDDMPLPIKSQRKLHMMMFPRPSMG